MYIYIWQFHVKEVNKKEFENLYGSQGEWIKLFEKDVAYIKTQLLHNIQEPNCYITIDYWATKAAYQLFCVNNKKEFHAIDKQGEKLTEKEEFLGEFYEK